MLHPYALHYPMTPYGGVFIATVGVCVIAGAVLGNYRDNLVWIGFALGTVLLLGFGGILSRGLHSPTLLQVSFLALAILLEIAGFRYLMPAVRPRGERATLGATLGIVGAHFPGDASGLRAANRRAGPRLHTQRGCILALFRLSRRLRLVRRRLP